MPLRSKKRQGETILPRSYTPRGPRDTLLVTPRTLNFDAQPAYRRAKRNVDAPPTGIDKLLIERKPSRPRRRPRPLKVSSEPLPPRVWVENPDYPSGISAHWDVDDMLDAILPSAVSRTARRFPRLEWTQKTPNLWLGKITLQLPNGPVVHEIGVLPSYAQSFQHDLLPR